MHSYASFQELDVLGEAISKDYLKRTRRWNAMCFDIEGFIAESLKLPIVYECFAETDSSKIGFLANGVDPLRVWRDGKVVSVVFPKDTIVIETYLLSDSESSRRRFTLAHEAAHCIMNRHIPVQTQGAFHSEYTESAKYSTQDLRRIFSLNETLTNRLGAAMLMPGFLVDKALKKYHGSKRVVCYDGSVFSQEEKICIQKMANSLGVSFSALINRLRELNKLEIRSLDEYLTKHLGLGGTSEA